MTADDYYVELHKVSYKEITLNILWLVVTYDLLANVVQGSHWLPPSG